jgi:hypothetical protein
MTENDAKGKWCPMVRIAVSDAHGAWYSRDNKETCIASDCMAWRSRTVQTRTVRNGVVQVLSGPDGYCGLAGKPG